MLTGCSPVLLSARTVAGPKAALKAAKAVSAMSVMIFFMVSCFLVERLTVFASRLFCLWLAAEMHLVISLRMILCESG